MLLLFMTMEDEETRSKLEVLYENFADEMYHHAYRILGNEQDAEDAVHNAFLRILEHIDKIGDPKEKKARAFVMICTENIAIDLYRKRKHTASLSEKEMDQMVSERIDCEKNDLVGLILRLPVKDRNILFLKYLYGFQYREIGKLLSISEDNAKKAGQRAKAKLENLCREEGVL